MRPGRLVLEVLTALYRLRLVLLLVAVLFVIAFFWAEIDPARVYGFGGGALHGLFGFQNLILSWPTGREIWAPSNTGFGYTAGFWCGLFVLPALIRNLIRVIVIVLKS